MALSLCAQTPPANWTRSSASPPTDSKAWYSLGYVRNTESIFSSCCQSPGALFTPHEPFINTTDPGLKDCFRYCNITAPGITVFSIFECVEDALKAAGIENDFTQTSENTTSVQPGPSSTVVVGTGAPSSRASQTPVATGGAVRIGGAERGFSSAGRGARVVYWSQIGHQEFICWACCVNGYF
ncbi:hypothetical protein T440DRAFT_543706 [Plenodomus tracheiphilus IPT5]|uniref:Uncharacterized protein n=1 Tax=Plenodomus tracheiphilus IPT5 TaxID=1408161 RepID=A0A6A7AQQ9_9PLEO|nr:hypothetical protein T440DRAFT_543706 [Plenodomus tracheiphilus IPT5]